MVLLMLIALSFQLEQARGQDTPTGSAPRPQAPSQPATPGAQVPTGAHIAVVTFEGDIMWQHQQMSLEHRINRAVKAGADVIVIEINTFGGRLDIALELSKFIKSINIRTVAWVHPKAYSAGSLMAAACDEIIMSHTASIGDCAPISLGGNLAPTERAKVLSPLLAEFRDNAEENYSGNSGNDYALFHAMCVLGIDVFQVEHKTTGEVRFVNAYDYAVLVDGQTLEEALATVEGAMSPGTRGGEEQRDGSNVTFSERVEVAGPSQNLADADQRGQWKLVRQVHDGQTLLTLSEKEAIRLGLSHGTVSNLTELENHYHAASVYRVRQTWSETIAWFLIHPIIRGILITLLLLGGLLEYMSPGLVIPGVIASIALVLLMVSPFMVGLSHIWHLVVFGIGLVMLAIELVAMPGFGFIGLAGLILMLVGLALAIVPSTTKGPISLPAPGSWDQVLYSALSLVVGVIITIPSFIIITRYFTKVPAFNRLVLSAAVTDQAASQSGAVIAKPHLRVSGDDAIGKGGLEVGMTGQAITDLRPAGTADLDGKTIDVATSGNYIPAGTPIKITLIRGSMITVEKA